MTNGRRENEMYPKKESIVEPQLWGVGMRKKEQKQAEDAGRSREVVGSWRILRSRLNTTEVRSTRKRVEKTPLPDTRAEETKETDS